MDAIWQHINNVFNAFIYVMHTFNMLNLVAQCIDEYFEYKQKAALICVKFNSLRPSDAYMRQLTNHHWFW